MIQLTHNQHSMGHMMDGLAMKYINKYFKHISNERHVLTYLFI